MSKYQQRKVDLIVSKVCGENPSPSYEEACRALADVLVQLVPSPIRISNLLRMFGREYAENYVPPAPMVVDPDELIPYMSDEDYDAPFNQYEFH